MARWILPVVLLFAAWGDALAQVGSDNPVLKEVARLAYRGVPKADAPATSPGKYKPTGRLIALDEYVASLSDDKEEVKVLKEFLTGAIDEQTKWAQTVKGQDDCVSAVAYAVSVTYMCSTGTEVDEKALADLYKNLRAALDVPAVKNATDTQKQQAREIAVYHASMVLVTVAAANSEEQVKDAQTFSLSMFELLTGTDPTKVDLAPGSFTLKPNGKKDPDSVEPPTASSGLAPGFAYKSPAGWQQSGAWLVKRAPSVANSTDSFAIANVRFAAPIPASGNIGTALYQLWEKEIPAELKGRAGGMVYRRYIGDGLVSNFVFGKGRETDHKSDTVFTIYLIDCKTHWQPVIVALTYEDNISFAVQMSADFSYSTSAALAEEVLATVSCQPAKGLPLIDQKALAGDYKFGSGSNMNWVNVYTGATAMSFVTYGGDLFLKPDGTFIYNFSSASGQVGATTYGKANGKGKWVIQGDILVCTFTQYDQGQGNQQGKVYKYKVAGLTQFQDGTKVAVLLDKLETVPNCSTVGDSSNWYSTGK